MNMHVYLTYWGNMWDLGKGFVQNYCISLWNDKLFCILALHYLYAFESISSNKSKKKRIEESRISYCHTSNKICM